MTEIINQTLESLKALNQPRYNMLKHGHQLGGRQTKTYSVWAAMKRRCFTKTNHAYKHYGGRGITVCERWMEFENFLEDMGTAPEGLSIERINNNGNYEPENCRWATQRDQMWNTRNTIRLTVNGKTKSAREWCKEFGVSINTVQGRLSRGWSAENALSKPPEIKYAHGKNSSPSH